MQWINIYIIYIWETTPSNWGIFHCHLYPMSLSQFSLSNPARARRVGHFLVQLLTWSSYVVGGFIQPPFKKINVDLDHHRKHTCKCNWKGEIASNIPIIPCIFCVISPTALSMGQPPNCLVKFQVVFESTSDTLGNLWKNHHFLWLNPTQWAIFNSNRKENIQRVPPFVAPRSFHPQFLYGLHQL